MHLPCIFPVQRRNKRSVFEKSAFELRQRLRRNCRTCAYEKFPRKSPSNLIDYVLLLARNGHYPTPIKLEERTGDTHRIHTSDCSFVLCYL